MPRWSPPSLPRLRCQVCGSELVQRSRTNARVVACQNWHCRDFDKPVDPAKRIVEAFYGPTDDTL
jgi:ssDNA-binding Zn-finger/Zn-ribbon topoisomerase 1